MKTVDTLNSSRFETEVIESAGPVVVDFYAPWCAPCRMLGPIMDKLADQYDGRIRFYKVNVDDEPDLAGVFGISGVPTVLMFRDGNLVDGFVGLNSPQAIQDRLDTLSEVTAEQPHEK